jgi:DNA-binding response OmpR family regulator
MADAKKGKILHIEDDRNIQLLVKTVLERAGLEVFSAFDAMQGVMMVRAVKPDVVVLDVMMPAGGGASVHERIRALNTSFTTPILIYSASDPADIAKRIPADPLTLILQKPAPASEIVASVLKLLALKPA